jgi:hypothetical protein
VSIPIEPLEAYAGLANTLRAIPRLIGLTSPTSTKGKF